MQWKYPPRGFEAQPFAIHLVSSASGRSLVEWLRIEDMRKSINPIVKQVLKQAEAMRAREEAPAAASASAGPAASESAASPPSHKPRRSARPFLPPPSLFPHITLLALLPTSGHKGMDRGPSHGLARAAMGQPVPPSEFLHDNPRTTLPMPPPRAAAHAAHTPAAFCLYLLAVAMPEAAQAALPASAVPRMHSRASCAPSAAPARSPRSPLDTLPPTSSAAARAHLCTSVSALLPPPIRQPLFLLRRFHPATGKVQHQTIPAPSSSSHSSTAEAETWLTFPQLCAPALGLHPTVLYAARCRLVALCGLGPASAVGGFRFSHYKMASLPTPGAALRAIPGHFLRGCSSLDRARGFVADAASYADSSIASMQLRLESRAAARALQEWTREKTRMENLMLSRGKDPADCELPPPPALEAVAPRARAALRMQELRPVDVKTALELHDAAAFAAAERQFWAEGEALEEGLIARRLLARSDGSVLHCQLTAGFPEEQGKDEAMIALERRVEAEAERTGGKGDPALLALIASSQGVHARFMFRLRVFASNTGIVTSRWVNAKDMLLPLADPHAFDRGLSPDQDSIPGNPFLEQESWMAACGMPVAPREVPVVTRLCPAGEVQAWVGGGDGLLGSVEAAARHAMGLHPSIPVGGAYHVSLWIRPERGALREGGGVEEEGEVGKGGGGAAAPAASAPPGDSWEWDAHDEGHPLVAGVASTLTMTQSYAAAGRDSGQLERFPRTRRGLPRFTLRVHYIRLPCPAWETPEEHDARMHTVPGVRKSARMAISEFKHWTTTGNFPSSARLPRITTREHVFAAAFPRIRLQAHGAVQPWMEPVYAYRVSLAQLALTAANPLLEAMPKGAPKRRAASPSKTPAASPVSMPGSPILQGSTPQQLSE